MPRCPRADKLSKSQKYREYKWLLLMSGQQGQWKRWCQHLQELRLLGLPQIPETRAEALLRLAERDARPVTPSACHADGASRSASREGEPGYLGVYCITCGEDCLPLDPFGICGWCERIPATGEPVAYSRKVVAA